MLAAADSRPIAPIITRYSHALRHSFALLLALAAGAARAHTDQVSSGSFLAGYLHPLTGLDHVLAMVAVGIWGAASGRPRMWALPLAFALSMVFGAGVAIAGVALPFVEHGIALSVVALGLVILGAWQVPIGVAVAVVAVFGLLHGFAHGAEMPDSAAPVTYAAGFLAAAGILNLAGIAIGALKYSARNSQLLRAGGGLIAATGVWILAGVLGAL